MGNSTQQSRNARKTTAKTSSKYRGVTWVEVKKRWRVNIRIDGGKRLYIGYFQDEKEAALAYNNAAKKYHGEFAWLNKLD